METVRIALISDIHGNLVGLSRVLEDIDERGVDAVACLGDVATLGPRPAEVLDLLRARSRIFIAGNHDDYLTDPARTDSHAEAPPVAAAIAWCRAELPQASIAFLRTFQDRVELDLGSMRLLLFHGSPASNLEDLLSDSPEKSVETSLASWDAKVFAGGHTHVQMVRRIGDRLLVNPGSVGLPFEAFVAGAPPRVLPHAEYAIVEVRGTDVAITLRRVEVDRARLLDEARSWKQPLGAYLAAEYAR